GGIHGKQIEIIVMDDGGVPEKAAAAAQTLINQRKVSALLAGVASSLSFAMAPVAQGHQVPMISPSSTHPRVTEYGDYIFRACYIDPFQGPAMAKFGMDKLGAKRAAILHDAKNEYSLGLANFFKDKFVKLGGKIVADQSYQVGDVDFKKQLAAIRKANPQFV